MRMTFLESKMERMALSDAQSVPPRTDSAVFAPRQRLDENPAVVHLASLSPGSRQAMERALTTAAHLLTADEQAIWQDIPWHRRRFQHATAARVPIGRRVRPQYDEQDSVRSPWHAEGGVETGPDGGRRLPESRQRRKR
jgi:hypothetical protein